METKKKKLIISKEVISLLSDSSLNNVKGGQEDQHWSAGGCTTGCSDGCGTFRTFWNCTNTDCTADC